MAMTAKERADAVCMQTLNAGDEDLAKAIEVALKEATEDDPQWDGTAAAHPAWWRGNDRGVVATLAIVRNALHGMKHTGMYGEPMESVVKEIEALVGKKN